MRDPKRIDPTLEKVAEVWKRCPDLRLGQLVCILCKGKDPFNVEDEDLLEVADAIIP